MKKAFTMLELVMVMVVLGIVASIGADIITSMYTNYLRSRTINALESKTEIVLEQIAKRLQYRIKDSVIARRTGSITTLSNADETYPILEWIGYSNESFLGTPRPGWSGFIDLDSNETNGTNRTLKTSESNLTDAADTISVLSYGTVDLSDGHEAALIFKGRSYNHTDFGWNTNANTDENATLKVKIHGTSIDIFEISNDSYIPPEIYEQYYLAHTAYAIAPTGTTTQNGFTDFNLTLYYNYQPWLGNSSRNDYGDINTSQSILTENASLFRFRQDETIMRLKLCLHDNNQTGVGDYIVVCKEKVIY